MSVIKNDENWLRSLFSINKETSCWEWQSTKDLQGYGKIFYFDETEIANTEYAHRFFFKLYKGNIPKEYVIDHLCYNKGCVNPDHLEAVTRSENTKRYLEYRNNKPLILCQTCNDYHYNEPTITKDGVS